MKDCPKCSSNKVAIKHVPEGKLINSSSFKRVENDFIRSSEYDYFFQLKAKIEHLLFNCGECQYSWRGRTSDNT